MSSLPVPQPTRLRTPEWGGRPAPPTVSLGRIYAHAVTFDEAIDLIVERAAANQGGYVVTPNVDHVVLAEHHLALRDAYNDAWLAIPDGMPLLWIAKAAGTPLPQKVSGSDLMVPLMRRAVAAGLTVAFLGAKEEVSMTAADTAQRHVVGLNIVARECPVFDETAPEPSPDVLAAVLRLQSAQPDIVFVAMGAPRQEVFMQRFAGHLGSSVMIGVGGSLDFLAGVSKRAPEWMQRSGLEWLYRLTQDPRRLVGRYLGRDWRIALIAARTIRTGRLRGLR